MKKVIIGLLIGLSVLVGLFLIGVIVFLVAYISFARPFEISGRSMQPNFLDNELVLTKIVNDTSPLPKGTVIIFKSAQSQADRIGRIIAVPNDKIRLSGGKVYLNGNILNEPYLSPNTNTYGGAFLEEEEELQIPADSYFVMGDNRVNSLDSRETGFIPAQNVISTYWFCYANCPK